MPYIKYIDYAPNAKTVKLIDLCDSILRQFRDEGYTLTVRQLYYQLVSLDHIPNNQRSYKALVNTTAMAREAGMLDWDHIEDRTRNVRSHSHWEDGADFMKSVVPQYRHDLWDGQETRVFVFVEKEALEQVVGKEASKWDVPYFANKGYLSLSAIWDIARNMMLLNESDCKHFVILHLGDHDPSGIDMSRDIIDRARKFAMPTSESQGRVRIHLERLALNMDQIDEYNPPPNPAKTTDSRFADYESKFGDESWELDALKPSVVANLIKDGILRHLDLGMFNERAQLQSEIRHQLLSDAGLLDEEE